jgi:hypothetical protein
MRERERKRERERELSPASGIHLEVVSSGKERRALWQLKYVL